jgi:hypothetical protein
MLSLLPVSLQPYAKAVYPAIMAVLATVAYGLVNRAVDVRTLEVGLVGLVSASLSFAVANGSAGAARYAKGLTPGLLTVAGVLVHYLITGEWGDAEWVAGASGLVASFLALAVPNSPVGVVAAGAVPVPPVP